MFSSEIYISCNGIFSNSKGLRKVWPDRELETNTRSDLELASDRYSALRGKRSIITATLCSGQDNGGKEDYTVFPSDQKISKFIIQVGHFNYPQIVEKVKSGLGCSEDVILELQ